MPAADNNHDDDISMKSTDSALSSTTEELFRIWAQRLSSSHPSAASSETLYDNDELRREAKSFFRSLTKETQVQVGGDNNHTPTILLQTKPSHESALARLLQQLGPAFTSNEQQQQQHQHHHQPSERLGALTILLGALEGCATKAPLSNQMVSLLSTFLLSHCGPLKLSDENEHDANNSSFEEEDRIRDCSLEALTILLRSQSLVSTDNDTKDNEATMMEAIRIRLDRAQRGVERRCASPELDSPLRYDHGMGPSSPPTPAGLSALPRSRRSLCFALLRAGVDSVSLLAKTKTTALTQEIGLALEPDLVAFTSYVASCLYGESDPRCLLQLIQLFAALMHGFYPFFFMAQSSQFPLEELFDAIAAYYPIQFTPPPNDVHGITRQGLNDALLAVLCSTQYDHLAQTAGKDTLLSLSLSIILERFENSPVEDAMTSTSTDVSLTEKFEAVKDLNTLLFPPNAATPNCTSLSTMALRQISDALLSLHEEASIQVAAAGSGEEGVAKRTADTVRTLVAKLAFECERETNHPDLWETFVSDPLRLLSSKLQSSPSHGRVAIAYMATLAACGGPKTLRRCLEAGIAPLLQTISSNMHDDNDIATSAYGIGAFFSSCRTTMAKAKQDGVSITPNPLEIYCVEAVDKLISLCSSSESKHQSAASPQLQTAAIRAMESVLIASPAKPFTSDHSDRICLFLETISSQLTTMMVSTKDARDLLEACTTTVGGILGHVLDCDSTNTTSESDCLLESERFHVLVKEKVAPQILIVAKTPSAKSKRPRFDWKALAVACSGGPLAASYVVRPFLESLRQSLSDNQFKDAYACAKALSYLFAQKDGAAALAFHSLAPPCVTPFDILNELCCAQEQELPSLTRGVEESLSTMLKLPPNAEERSKLASVMSRTHKIVALLRRAYYWEMPSTAKDHLVDLVTDALPPLNEADVLKLAVTLPCLSAALETMQSLPSTESSKLKSALPDLAEFVIDSIFDDNSRSHAAQCLYGGLRLVRCTDDEECPSHTVLVRCASPLLKRMKEMKNGANKSSSTIEAMRLLAIIGSAAACRGESSAKTADRIVVFFADLACSKIADLSLDTDNTIHVEVSEHGGRDFSVEAASFLGSIFTAGSCGSLWRQRLTHITVKRLQFHLQKCNLDGKAPSPGMVATACHITCSTKPKTISSVSLQVISKIVILALEPDALPSSDEFSLKTLLLATILKLITISPDSISPNIAYITTGIIRTYATAGEPGSTGDIALKLMCLQALQSIARMHHGRDALTEVKPAVVSLLSGAMNHPSAVLRQAVVEVRNTWFVMGIY